MTRSDDNCRDIAVNGMTHPTAQCGKPQDKSLK